MAVTKSGIKLAEVIKKAIEDHVVTEKEYHEIMSVAEEDYHIDDHERKLLAELKNMIANGTVKRSQ